MFVRPSSETSRLGRWGETTVAPQASMITPAPRTVDRSLRSPIMANPTPAEPEVPRPWYAGLIGFMFAAIVLGAVALATAASYDSSDDDHGGEHSEEEADHSDDDGEHGDDE